MPFAETVRSLTKMEEYTDTSSLSVVDVYDIASEIGKEFEKLIESFGPDSIINLVPKVINALEALENLATKNERENTEVQSLQAKISQLQTDKFEKLEERQRFEKVNENICRTIFFLLSLFISETYFSGIRANRRKLETRIA